jgi:hypothetical protein
LRVNQGWANHAHRRASVFPLSRNADSAAPKAFLQQGVNRHTRQDRQEEMGLFAILGVLGVLGGCVLLSVASGFALIDLVHKVQ